MAPRLSWMLALATVGCAPGGLTPATTGTPGAPTASEEPGPGPDPTGDTDADPPVETVTLPACVPAAPVVINELVASNLDGLVDADGDTPDWIELYNDSDAIAELAGWGLSEDGGDPYRWVFPPLPLGPRRHLLVLASGKDHRAVVSAWDTRVDWGDSWRYRAVVAPVDPGWIAPGFDDSGWLVGPSGFGRGDGDDASPVDTHTLYARTEVFLTPGERVDLGALYLHVDFDDSFVAYLNGVEVARANIGTPGIQPAWDDLANADLEAVLYGGGTPQGWDLGAALPLVVDGRNVLAIEVHDVSFLSDDLSLIPFLTLGFGPAFGAVVEPSPHLALPDTLLSTNFLLRAEGERVRLTDPQGCRADEAVSGQLYADMSYGRQADGAGPWGLFMEPTPGASNTTEWRPGFAETPLFDLPQGHATPGAQVAVGVKDAATVVYVATGGEEPTPYHPEAAGPVSLVGDEAVVLRARAYRDDLWPSRIATGTWILTAPGDLPVLSLVTDPPNLWDPDFGIYVLGPDYDPNVPYWGANFWEDWERPLHVTMWEPDGTPVFAVDAGVKIHGGWTRANAQKSLRLQLRAGYGHATVEGPLFPGSPVTSFSRLVLRTSGNDWYGCGMSGCSDGSMLRDRFMHRLTRGADIDAMADRPAAVYLNGAYWGLYNLRERPDRHYVASHHGEPDIDLLEFSGIPIDGDAEHYVETLDFLRSVDLADPAHDAEVRARIDVASYATYQAFQIYYDNTDWPGNNIKFWRPRTVDGRWRWLLYDTDFGLGRWGSNPADDTLAFALEPYGPGWPNPPWSTELFRLLMTSPTFTTLFVNTYADLLNTALTPEVARAALHAAEGEIAAEWTRHHDRWGHYPVDTPIWQLGPDTWTNEIAWMDSWLGQRPAHAFAHVTNNLGFARYQLDLDASPPGSSRFALTAAAVDAPFTGTYFQGVGVEVTVLPQPGYTFVGWSDPNLPADPTVVLDPGGDYGVTALLQ